MKLFDVLILAFLLTASQVICQSLDYEYSQKDDYYEVIEDEEPNEPIVKEPPPVFKEKSKKITVREGDRLELSCEAESSTERVVLFKKEYNKKMKPFVLFAGKVNVFDSNFKEKDMKYSVENVTRKESATYLCVYQTIYDGEIQIRYEVNVEYPPQIRPIKPTRQEVMKGDNVSFECKADGNPKPKVKWSRENGKLPSGTTEEKGKTLIFMDVDRHVEGTYICSADNGIGKPAIYAKKLMVQYPPEIITEKEIVRTGEGDKVELVCIVHSRPHAIVNWSRDGNKTLVRPNNTMEMDRGHRHSLTIFQVTEENFGTYTCTAVNSVGNISADINLTDLPMKPNFTSDPTSADDTKYTLTWYTDSYYPITEYRIQYREFTTNATEELPWKEDSFEITAEDAERSNFTHNMKHVISGLKAATDYEAVVSVKNELKWGDISTFQFSTKKESASSITGSGSILSTSIMLLTTSRIISIIS